jgi:hypothetical protein
MGRDDSRIARVLGELADLGRRIGERAEELASLAGKGGKDAAATAADGTADVAVSAARLAASAADLASVTHEAAPAAGGVRRTADTPRTRVARPEDQRRVSRNAKPAHHARHSVRRSPPQARRATTTQSSAEGRRQTKPFGPVLVSTAMHLVVLVGLALIFVARDAKPERFVITSDAPAEALVEEFTPLEFEVSDSANEDAADLPEPSLSDLAAVSELLVVADMAMPDDLVSLDTAAVMPVSFDSADLLATVGGGGEGEAGGNRGGAGRGAGTAGAPTFFGRKGQGQSVCFVCDNSNSYRDGGFHMVLAEVARAVDALQPGQSFFVIFFSDDAYPMCHPEPLDALLPATRENKQRLQTWLNTLEMCSGGQGIHEALKLAAELGVEVVYFLSDGDHAESVVDRVTTAEFGDTVVHTFGMQQNVFDKRTGAPKPELIRAQQAYNENLAAIAAAHGGTFTPVVVPPQAAAMEQVRPITKNRTRGPVWGLKLDPGP